MSQQDAIEARSARKLYGTGPQAVAALDGVSLAIRKGEFFTLLGPSGCGKTTLLRLIAGFETPTSGQILLDGRDITEEPPNRRPVNTVFQSYALFPHLTVRQNIGFGLQMQGRSTAEIAEKVQHALALVRLEAMADRRPQQLSGGQQQRVALARALAPSPEVLLLDEPLSALDLKLRKEMQSELKRLQLELGITFIFVTHDQEEALTMSDRIGVMSAGRAPAGRPPARDLQPPGQPLRRGLHRRDELPSGRGARRRGDHHRHASPSRSPRTRRRAPIPSPSGPSRCASSRGARTPLMTATVREFDLLRHRQPSPSDAPGRHAAGRALSGRHGGR